MLISTYIPGYSNSVQAPELRAHAATRQGRVPPHFLDTAGGIRADRAVIRLEVGRCRIVCGGDTGYRDHVWMRRMAGQRG